MELSVYTVINCNYFACILKLSVLFFRHSQAVWEIASGEHQTRRRRTKMTRSRLRQGHTGTMRRDGKIATKKERKKTPSCRRKKLLMESDRHLAVSSSEWDLSLVHPLNVNQFVVSSYKEQIYWRSLTVSDEWNKFLCWASSQFSTTRMVWVHEALALVPQKLDLCGAKCKFTFPALAAVTKFSDTLSDSHCLSDSTGKALS